MSAPTRTSHGPSTLSSPPARRPTTVTWRDPRLVLGIALVAGSVLLGVKLFSGADDTVSLWVAAADLPSGTKVSADDLERREVGFAKTGDGDRYLSAASVPDGARLLRDVGVGELLARSALGDAGSSALVEVPVAVAAESVPTTVRAGSVVDVWVTPHEVDDAERTTSVLVFDDVVVVAAPRSGTALGPGVIRQVIIGVEPEQEDELAAALARAATGATLITKQG